jgi:hypothetical protein
MRHLNCYRDTDHYMQQMIFSSRVTCPLLQAKKEIP